VDRASHNLSGLAPPPPATNGLDSRCHPIDGSVRPGARKSHAKFFRAAKYARIRTAIHTPDAEKIYSIFEPHTDLIKPGKMQTSLEFGHKVFLAESAKRLITQYEVLDGNPSDQRHVEPSLKRHKKTCGHRTCSVETEVCGERIRGEQGVDGATLS
jgi:hypothetical protein